MKTTWNKTAAATLTICALASSALAGTYTFNDNTLGGLTTYNPLTIAAFDTSAANLYIHSGATFDLNYGVARGAAYAAGFSLSTFQTSVDLVGWDSNINQAIGLMGYLNNVSPGQASGYAFTYQTSTHDLYLSRVSSEYIFPLTSTAVTLDPAKDYRMQLVGGGGALIGTIYDLSDLSSPLAVIFASDSTYTSGTCGVLLCAMSPTAGVSATFDNLTIIPEPTILALLGLGSMMIWRRRAVR